MSEKNNRTIKQLLSELDETVDYFNSSDIEIEKSIEMYKKGLDLADQIKAKLDTAAAELDIEVINN